MTMDLYGHLVDANLWEAARAIGGILGASEPPGQQERTQTTRERTKVPGKSAFSGGEVFTFRADLGKRGLGGGLPTG